jgi:lysophospholipase L1-like esterase
MTLRIVPLRNTAVLWTVGTLLLVLSGACTMNTGTPSVRPSGASADPVRYVALGDSYTIGTSVSPAETWPQQLVDRSGGQLILSGNLATNAFTSEDLILHQLPQLDSVTPELVSVLIGVNDVVQGVPESTYATNVAFILDDLLGRLAANRIVAVATPDYTVTPMGAAFGNPDRMRAAIDRFNSVFQLAAARRNVAFVPEIFAISKEAADDPSLVAQDGLHPSGAQYALWVDAIEPVVQAMVADRVD